MMYSLISPLPQDKHRPGQYVAQFLLESGPIYLGSFLTENDATAAYYRASDEYETKGVITNVNTAFLQGNRAAAAPVATAPEPKRAPPQQAKKKKKKKGEDSDSDYVDSEEGSESSSSSEEESGDDSHPSRRGRPRLSRPPPMDHHPQHMSIGGMRPGAPPGIPGGGPPAPPSYPYQQGYNSGGGGGGIQGSGGAAAAAINYLSNPMINQQQQQHQQMMQNVGIPMAPPIQQPDPYGGYKNLAAQQQQRAPPQQRQMVDLQRAVRDQQYAAMSQKQAQQTVGMAQIGQMRGMGGGMGQPNMGLMMQQQGGGQPMGERGGGGVPPAWTQPRGSWMDNSGMARGPPQQSPYGYDGNNTGLPPQSAYPQQQQPQQPQQQQLQQGYPPQQSPYDPNRMPPQQGGYVPQQQAAYDPRGQLQQPTYDQYGVNKRQDPGYLQFLGEAAKRQRNEEMGYGRG